MSLQNPGVWRAGAWAPTAWRAGCWREDPDQANGGTVLMATKRKRRHRTLAEENAERKRILLALIESGIV